MDFGIRSPTPASRGFDRGFITIAAAALKANISWDFEPLRRLQ